MSEAAAYTKPAAASNVAAEGGEEEEEDYVVAEYDVYLSTALSGNLHLFQFPLRPFSRPYEASSVKLYATSGHGIGGNIHNSNNSSNVQQQQATHPTATASTPDQSRYTMEVNLDAYDSPCFRLAPPAPGKEMGNFTYYLSSEPFVPKSHFAVGVLRDGGLHLCPISTIQQFTPAVRAESRMVASSGSGGGEDFGLGNLNQRGGPTTSQGGGPLVAVEMKYCSVTGPQAGEGPGALLTREQESLRLLRSSLLNVDAATARPIAFYHLETPESQTKANLLTSTVLAQSSSVPPQPLSDGTRQPKHNIASTTETFFSAEKLLDIGAEVSKRIVLKRGSRFSVREQVQDLIVAAQVLTTGDVMSLVVDRDAPADATAADTNSTFNKVVRALMEFAYYMHGVWVSRTPPLKSGFPQIRDLVLLLFAQSKSGTVHRKDISAHLTRNHPAVPKAVLRYLTMVAELIDPARRYMTNTDLSQVWGTHERSFGLPAGDATFAEGLAAEVGRAWRLKRSDWKQATSSSIAEPQPACELQQRVADLCFTPKDFTVFNAKFEADFKTDIMAQQNLWIDGGRNQRIVAEAVRAINEGRDVGITQAGIVGGGSHPGGRGGGVQPPSSSTAASPLMPTSTSTASQGIAAGAGANNSQEMVNAIKQYITLLFGEHGVINKSQAKQKIQLQSRDQRSAQFGASADALTRACRELLVGFTPSTFVLANSSIAEVAPYRRYILTATAERSQFTAADIVERVVSQMEKLHEGGDASAAGGGADVNRAAVKAAVNAMLPEIAVFKAGERLWHVKSGTIEM